MGSEAFSGTIYKPGGVTAWEGGVLLVRCVRYFTDGTYSYPGHTLSITADENGQFSTNLGVPDNGWAEYALTLPKDDRALSEEIYFRLAVGEGPLTLEAVLAGAASSAAGQDTLLTLLNDYLPLAGGVMTGQVNFDGTDHAGLKLLSLTTAERDALTPTEGMLIYNETDSQVQAYQGAAWVPVPVTAAQVGAVPEDAAILSKSAGYELAAGDEAKMIEVTATAAINCPDGLNEGFQVVVVPIGGTVTATADTTMTYIDGGVQTAVFGVTINNATILYHKGSNVWRAIGDVTAI